MNQGQKSSLYCTWSHRAQLPPALKDKFADLDHFLRGVIRSATLRLVLVAPYLSPTGLAMLQGAMAVAVSRGAWIRLVTGNLDDPNSLNRQALRALVAGPDGYAISRRLRVLTGSDALPVLLHAKVAVADGTRGYLGSANLSWHALEDNLELGVALPEAQAAAIESLISFLESSGSLVDVTESALIPSEPGRP